MSRFTRSRNAPGWTLQETLTLIIEISAVDEECRNSVSSHQKWNIIANHLVALDFSRTAYQCRRKWDSLLADYRRVKEWESRSSGDACGSFWCLEVEKRSELGLPAALDRDVFGLVDGVVEKRRTKGGGGREEGSDVGEMDDMNQDDMLVDVVTLDSSGYDGVKDANGKNIIARLQEKAEDLEENVEQIEAILTRKLPEDVRRKGTIADLAKSDSIEFARRQADELITVFGSLIATLEQLK